MSRCNCLNPTKIRATSENTGQNFLYLRCGHCGGKLGTVRIDINELTERVTDPAVVEEPVTIRFDPHDSPWLFAGGGHE